jgi:hypothetical protein
MSCSRYSELVSLVRNSKLTALCVKSGEYAQQTNLRIYIQCVGCEWYVKCYTGEELAYFVKFNEPGITSFLCVTCTFHVYKSLERDGIHSERVRTLLNRADYWGVIDMNTARQIKSNFKSAGKCGSFVWEVQETFCFDKQDRALLIAVTHVRYSTYSHFARDSNDLDECTYYIAWSRGHGYVLMVRVGGSIIFESRRDLGCFTTLSDAIVRAQSQRASLSPQCVSRSLSVHGSCVHVSRLCQCTDISRFCQMDVKNSIFFRPQVYPVVWTLQDMSVFYIRNHSFHFQKEIAQTRELPKKLKNRIRDVRSVDMCFY